MWFIAALIVATGLTVLWFWLRGKGVKMAWYEILIGVVGVALILFGIQNYQGFTSEFESDAATTALLLMGIPGLLLLVVAGILIKRRNRAVS
ncbi:LPXTG cell wall anchor domain-containing protein [Dehalogenimonas sp. THU2]|uniref:LPXTG cell wall anchor domain-containing protein n=1 Tax=Dehalogenimonas sp. THU2 TaxID=3151121 RepID=UPI0032187FAC